MVVARIDQFTSNEIGPRQRRKGERWSGSRFGLIGGVHVNKKTSPAWLGVATVCFTGAAP